MVTSLDSQAVLKACVLIHFSLASLAMTAHWLPNGYLWSQSVLVVLGLWSVYSTENAESLNLLATANIVSIILDSIAVGVSWRSTVIDTNSLFQFTAAMAIILIIFKLVYAFVALRYGRERAGGEPLGGPFPTFGNWNPNRGPMQPPTMQPSSSYQNP